MHYAGTDRPQIVGVGSLLIESPLAAITSPYGMQFNVRMFSRYLSTTKEEAGRRKKNKVRRPPQKVNVVSYADKVAAIAATNKTATQIQ